MTQVIPTKEVMYEKLICPFCKGEWEFRLSDSFDNAEITFYCIKCKKKIVITKLDYKK